MEQKMIKRQEVEVDLITLKTTRLPYSLKQGDTNIHEITLNLDVEEGFEYERAQVHYSNGDYQDIQNLTFIMKNSAIESGFRSFEVEFVSGEEVRRSGRVEYRVYSSINSKYEAYDKYNELKKLYDVYVDAVDNEVQREQLKVELIELKNSIVSDLESINLAVDDIVGSENDRKQNEVIREEIKVELENLVIDIQNKLDNGDFTGEKGDPGEVTQAEHDELKNELAEHKLDYVSQRQQDNLKVAKVEKDINDYKSTMASVNVNQEAKQSVTGYGVVSLPKNSANGQVSVDVKGQTATNLLGEKGKGNSTDGWLLKLRITSNGTEIILDSSKAVVGNIPANIKGGNKYFLIVDLKIISGTTGIIGVSLRSPTGIVSGPPGDMNHSPYVFTATGDGDRLNFEIGVYGDRVYHVRNILLVDLTLAGDENLTLQELINKYSYVSNTKSTISASRLKSVDSEGNSTNELYLPNVGELRSLPNGVKDEIRVSGGKAELIKRVSDNMEELTEPIITPIEVSGTLLSYPSGTVYVENVVADAGVYTTKFDIKDIQLPIKSIDKLIKYNFETGVQTVLDTTLAVINEDKKSFTHPNLTDKDMVFVDYFYDVESTLGETTIEYLDSRHTIKDTANDKFYSWDIKSTNGVPTVNLTEVL